MRVLKAILFASIILLFSSLTVFAQSPSQTTVTKNPAVDVPMLFRGSMPAIEVMVNGQGPFLFAIDTGGQGLARVDSALVEKLKIQAVGKMQATDGSGQNMRTLDVVELDSIAFGGVKFQAVRAPTRNYNTSASMPRIDGILGFNLFSDYLLTLDYPAKRVRLMRGELPKPDGAEIISFENPNGIPIVELVVGSSKVNAHIDSGNTIGGFVLPTSLVEKLTFAATPKIVGRARSVSNDVEIKEGRLKEKIRLGRFEFAEPTVVYPALSDDANIGSKVLREFALTFDQKNKRLRLERHEQPEAAELTAASNASESNDYPGRYGERTISTEDGSLYLQRQGGPKLKLVSVSKDVFTLAEVPEARIKFARDESGRIIKLSVLNRAGEWEESKRERK